MWTQQAGSPHTSLGGFGEGPLPACLEGTFIRPMGQSDQEGIWRWSSPAVSFCTEGGKEGREKRRKLGSTARKALFQGQDSNGWRDMEIKKARNVGSCGT